MVEYYACHALRGVVDHNNCFRSLGLRTKGCRGLQAIGQVLPHVQGAEVVGKACQPLQTLSDLLHLPAAVSRRLSGY